jgi:CheY-like chemotaxis protein
MEHTKILVIDDCQDVLEVLSALLEFEGFQVRTAHGVLEAMTALDRGEYEAVICDIVLPLDPDMGEVGASMQTGVQCISQIRERHPHLPIVAMSGEMADYLITMVQRLGVQAALPKPFGLSALKGALKTALAR